MLTDLGFRVEYPLSQTCCGQPFANSGYEEETKSFAKKFVDIFSGYDYIVAPSASCVNMVKNHYKSYLPNDARLKEIEDSIYEICEFLVDVVKLDRVDVSFPHKVGFHQSCHGLRELGLGVGSELVKEIYSKPLSLLKMVNDIEIIDLKRPDECCGFGGMFSVKESEISIRMGEDRIEDHINSKAEYIVGYDSSCLMHMESIAKHQKRGIGFLHIIEILAGSIK
jgi:L-lactate dehydrogenase complex protein LldE